MKLPLIQRIGIIMPRRDGIDTSTGQARLVDIVAECIIENPPLGLG